MPRKRAEDRYIETAILTASQEELLVKLFDGLIQFSKCALDKMHNDPKSIEYIHKHLRKAQKACVILMGALDLEIGGETSINLLRIYEYWHHELVLANMRQDPSRIERLLPVFQDYRATWQKVIAQYAQSSGKVSKREVLRSQ